MEYNIGDKLYKTTILDVYDIDGSMATTEVIVKQIIPHSNGYTYLLETIGGYSFLEDDLNGYTFTLEESKANELCLEVEHYDEPHHFERLFEILNSENIKLNCHYIKLIKDLINKLILGKKKELKIVKTKMGAISDSIDDFLIIKEKLCKLTYE